MPPLREEGGYRAWAETFSEQSHPMEQSVLPILRTEAGPALRLACVRARDHVKGLHLAGRYGHIDDRARIAVHVVSLRAGLHQPVTVEPQMRDVGVGIRDEQAQHDAAVNGGVVRLRGQRAGGERVACRSGESEVAERLRVVTLLFAEPGDHRSQIRFYHDARLARRCSAVRPQAATAMEVQQPTWFTG